MKYLRSSIGLLVVFVEAALVCWWVFHVYGDLREVTANSDTLVMIDFSRDLLRGVPMSGWYLAHSLYLFPDVLIASLVIFFGWSNNSTLITIAFINYSLFIITCYIVLKAAYGLKRISLPGIGLVVTLSLFAITYVFPVSMSNVYWQLFSSGAHFGVVIFFPLILFLNKTLLKNSSVLLRVGFLCLLTVAAVVSDGMTSFLLMLWLVSEVFCAAWKRSKVRIDIVVVLFSMMIGFVLSSMIPHVSLGKDFISIGLFIERFHSFFRWFLGSFGNAVFIFSLVIASVVFPFLMQGRRPTSHENMEQMFPGKDFILPSLGVIVVCPMSFQDASCLRYLIFPAFILILCVVLVYLRLISLVKNNRIQFIILFLWFLLICFSVFFIYKKDKTEPVYESNAAKICQCIKRASLEYPLQDGIASYWNARPVKFYSNFGYYLAQVSPWEPKDGYFLWLNNWYEFLYKDIFTKLSRKYNYIIATNDEIKSGLWGSVINKSKNKLTCGDYSLFYFDKYNILWDFLFFRGSPPELRKLDTGLPWGPACLSNSGSCIFTEDSLSTLIGVREGGVIKASGKPGFLVYGPYIPLDSGVYKLIIKCKLSGTNKVLGIVDVVVNSGRHILAVKSIVAGQSATSDIVSLDFEVVKPVTDIQFRIRIPVQTSGFFRAYELTKVRQEESRK